MAIRSFVRKEIAAFFIDGRVPRREGWRDLAPTVLRKLDLLEYAQQISDLKAPPGNRLEPLRGRLSGRHSIRVNDQLRIVFRWTDRGPEEVDVVDYHD